MGLLQPRPDSEPDWPTGDPSALVWWLEEGGANELGRDTNRWLGVIFYASQQIWSAHTTYERREFRDAALAATEEAWRRGGLSKYLYTEKRIYIRMSYVRNSDENQEWRREEMAQVLGIFLEWLPLDFESVRDKARNWQGQPVDVILSMRHMKTLMKLIQPGTSYLADDKREQFMEWLDLLPQLP